MSFTQLSSFETVGKGGGVMDESPLSELSMVDDIG